MYEWGVGGVGVWLLMCEMGMDVWGDYEMW